MRGVSNNRLHRLVPVSLALGVGLVAALRGTITAQSPTQSPAPAATKADPLAARLAAEVDALVQQHGSAQASIWVADRDGRVLFAREADVPRPTASAIKVPLLIELLARFDAKGDAKLTRATQIVDSPAHPAMRPFPAEAQVEIAQRLRQTDVATSATTMIRGTGVSNATYNAAANLVLAELGGPRGADDALAARWPGSPEIRVRRYMLAARDELGDNEATARALGRVWLALARSEIPGADPKIAAQARAALTIDPDPRFGAHLCKHGALDSLPLARVLSGCYERNGRALVYVVMLSQATLAQDAAPAAEGQRLEQTAAAVRDLLLQHLARRALWREV